MGLAFERMGVVRNVIIFVGEHERKSPLQQFRRRRILNEWDVDWIRLAQGRV